MKKVAKILIIVFISICLLFNMQIETFALTKQEIINAEDSAELVKELFDNNPSLDYKKFLELGGTKAILRIYLARITGDANYKEAKAVYEIYEQYEKNYGKEINVDIEAEAKKKNSLGVEYIKIETKINSMIEQIQTSENLEKETEELIQDEEKQKELEEFTPKEIYDYYNNNGKISLIENLKESTEGRSILKKWVETIKDDGTAYAQYKSAKAGNGSSPYPEGVVYYNIINEVEGESGSKSSNIYVQPNRTTSGDSSEESLGDMVSDAEKFVDKGEITYDAEDLQNFSKTLYNIALTIGVFVAVIMGAILGIKLMASGVEEKAEAKKILVPYVVGCIVVFGGFGVWKIVVTILQNI